MERKESFSLGLLATHVLADHAGSWYHTGVGTQLENTKGAHRAGGAERGGCRVAIRQDRI